MIKIAATLAAGWSAVDAGDDQAQARCPCGDRGPDGNLKHVWSLDVLGVPTAVAAAAETVPRTPAPAENYPQPFNATAVIPHQLPAPGNPTLDFYDLLGRGLVRLADGAHPAGRHTTSWDGHDERGRAVASGVYSYRRHAGGRSQSRRLMLLK